MEETLERAERGLVEGVEGIDCDRARLGMGGPERVLSGLGLV
jgi:hypothetical protein